MVWQALGPLLQGMGAGIKVQLEQQFPWLSKQQHPPGDAYVAAAKACPRLKNRGGRPPGSRKLAVILRQRDVACSRPSSSAEQIDQAGLAILDNSSISSHTLTGSNQQQQQQRQQQQQQQQQHPISNTAQTFTNIYAQINTAQGKKRILNPTALASLAG